MKKIFVAILTIALILTLCACGRQPGTGTPGGQANLYGDYIDPATGVHYLIITYDGTYGFGMAPRYNSDGTLMIEPQSRGR